MKIVNLILTILIISSCTQPKYRYIGQEIIDGKISATQDGHRGRASVSPRIWVQTPTKTQEVSIPFQYEGRWKVGDSCLLIIEKYEEICPK
jgi:hypothetical protein